MVYAEHPIAYNVLMWVLSLLGTVITSIIIPMVFKLLAARIKNENLKMIMDEIASTTKSSVSYTNQTFVDQMKRDGRFDAEAQKEAMLRATNYTFDTLTESTKRIIEKEGINIDALVKRYIEADIDDRHREKGSNSSSGTGSSNSSKASEDTETDGEDEQPVG